MRDLKSNIKVVPSLRPLNRNAAANGSGVEVTPFNAVAVSFVGGAITGTAPSFLFAVQESDDNVTFTDVAAADLRGAAPAITAANASFVVSYIGYKRYVRGILKTVGGTSTPTLDCSANVILGKPINAPTV